ncbi:hypothetical protein G7K_3332-t1 [Saitoella complicata NRRL Y-17804]|uniref:Uncharacterized protein n=1 Tax=Saitoella complicata (strain BCRC 22490 / CBS 7301 / JCM 7358 / NBRC 10748 / NRRL Y-17804) TaxID=698492 RepID=A0A0E9NH57_SAICN|nr:hypothetical protein G7K_3332-t1 [Saitoella complicata NRRL Y-17804]
MKGRWRHNRDCGEGAEEVPIGEHFSSIHSKGLRRSRQCDDCRCANEHRTLELSRNARRDLSIVQLSHLSDSGWAESAHMEVSCDVEDGD